MSDDFDELPGLKRKAAAKARQYGHQLTRWKVAAWSDTHVSAYCTRCLALVVLNLNGDLPVKPMSGVPVTRKCDGGGGWREGHR